MPINNEDPIPWEFIDGDVGEGLLSCWEASYPGWGVYTFVPDNGALTFEHQSFIEPIFVRNYGNMPGSVRDYVREHLKGRSGE